MAPWRVTAGSIKLFVGGAKKKVWVDCHGTQYGGAGAGFPGVNLSNTVGFPEGGRPSTGGRGSQVGEPNATRRRATQGRSKATGQRETTEYTRAHDEGVLRERRHSFF